MLESEYLMKSSTISSSWMPMHFKPFLDAKVTYTLHNDNIKHKEYSIYFLCHCMYTYANGSRKTNYQSQGRTPIVRKKAKIVTLMITRSRSPKTWPTATSPGSEWPRRAQHRRRWLEQCFSYRTKRCSRIRVCGLLASRGPGPLLTANTRHRTAYTHLRLQVKTCSLLRGADVLAGWQGGVSGTHLSNMSCFTIHPEWGKGISR